MNATVKFDRGYLDKFGRKVWKSKCGQFVIRRMVFDFPTKSIEYRLADQTTGRIHKHIPSLAEAKALANED